MWIYAVLGSILFNSSFVLAGDKVGNGGGVHSCANSIEVYDLYEGRERFDLSIISRNELNQEETVQIGIEKIAKQYPVLSRLIARELLEVEKRLKIKNIIIERTLDADNLFHDEGCEYRQVANWDMSIDKVLISNFYWNKLNDFNKGVLKLHEAAYSVYRKYGDNTGSAQDTRKFIAEVYSDGPITVQLVKYPYLEGGVIQFKNKQGPGFIASIILKDTNCKSDVYVEFQKNETSLLHKDVDGLKHIITNPGTYFSWSLRDFKRGSLKTESFPFNYVYGADIRHNETRGKEEGLFTDSVVFVSRPECLEIYKFTPMVIRNTKETMNSYEKNQIVIDPL